MGVPIRIAKILVVPLLFLVLYPIQTRLVGKWEDRFASEMVYLPRGEAVRRVRFGWNDIMADLLWIRGFHYVQGQWQLIEAGVKKPDEGWHRQLPDLYDVVTDLDPHFVPAYRGGSVLIRALAKNPQRAVELLVKGVQQNPTKHWDLPYELAVVNLIDLNDEKKALEWITTASDAKRYPKSDPMVTRMRASLEAKENRFDVAVMVWEPWLKSDSPVMQRAALNCIGAILLQETRSLVAESVAAFRKKEGRLPTDDEVKPMVELAKKTVIEKNRKEGLEGLLADVARWELQLCQVARYAPPPDEPKAMAVQLKTGRASVKAALQTAVARFQKAEGRLPEDIDELVREKFLPKVPVDRNGAKFYLEPFARRIIAGEKPAEGEPEPPR